MMTTSSPTRPLRTTTGYIVLRYIVSGSGVFGRLRWSRAHRPQAAALTSHWRVWPACARSPRAAGPVAGEAGRAHHPALVVHRPGRTRPTQPQPPQHPPHRHRLGHRRWWVGEWAGGVGRRARSLRGFASDGRDTQPRYQTAICEYSKGAG